MAVLSQAVGAIRLFKMIDANDHISKKTGLTPTVNISKNGAAFSGAAGTVAEVGNGWYSIDLTTNDTDTNGDLAFYITAGGADDTDFVDQVTTNNFNDTLPANVTQIASQNVNTGVAQLGVNVVQYASGTAGSTKFGTPDVNVKYYSLGTARTPTIAGIPIVDVQYFSGGTVITPNKIGVPIVDVQYYSGATTNPLISGRVDANAQAFGPGVNVTQYAGGTLSPTKTGIPDVNVRYWSNGTVVTPNKLGIPIVDVSYFSGATTNTQIAQVGVNVVQYASGTASALRVKKNTALANFEFLMLDSADHVTPKTGLTVTGTVSLDGAAFGALTNSVAELSDGIYTINLAAADLNGNVCTLLFTATGADNRYITIVTQA